MGGKGGKGSHRTCAICGVKEKHTVGPLLFSQFPLNESRCKAWLRAVGNEELVHLPIEKLHQLRHVCRNHFKEKDINKKRNRLKKRAIPMLNLTAASLSDAQLIGFPLHVAKNRNDAPPAELPSNSQRQQVHPFKQSETVADPETPCSGPSTRNQAEQSRNAKSTKRHSECTENEEHSGKKRKLKEKKCKDNVIASINPDLFTPRKKKLMEGKQLRKTKCTLNSLKRSANLIEKIESHVLKVLRLSPLGR